VRTPAGTECRYYYQDFHRGRSVQTCRLIDANPDSEPWRPGLCQTCRVPEILRANGCPNMVLRARVGRRWLLRREVRISAFCTQSDGPVEDPMVGCGQCHDARWEAIRESLRLDE